MQVCKLDAARRQLETAITLYFNDGDPISLHTLAGAAYDVLRGVNRARGGEPMIKDWVRESFQPDYRKTVDKALNEAQNFFKHADRDANDVLEYDPERA